MERIIFYLYISSMSNHLRFEILDAHKTYCPADWQWDNPGREVGTYNLWLVTDGQGTMRIGDRTYEVEAGDCFVLRLDEPCSGRHNSAYPLTVPWIIFRVYGEDANHDCWQAPQLYRRIWGLSFFAELVERAIFKHSEASRSSEEAVYWLQVALHVLVEEDARMQAGLNANHAEAIHYVCERIRCELGHTWTVTELAESCHVSPGHFTRIFKAYTGMGPRAFITRTRIKAAEGLLRMSSHTIGEIAELLGYGDVFHFSRQFREQSGMSPSTYRNMPANR